MTELVQTIFNFFSSLYDSIFNYFYNNSQYNFIAAFWDKQVLNGELLSIGMNWAELLKIVLPMLITLLLIFLVFKILWKALFGKLWR